MNESGLSLVNKVSRKTVCVIFCIIAVWGVSSIYLVLNCWGKAAEFVKHCDS